MDSKTILVVDDEPTVRTLIADMLAASGHTCITAATGIDAIRIVEADVIHIDLVLSDVMMPGELDGFQLAERVKELKPDAEVLLISGYVEPDTAAAIARRGIRVLRKPFRQQHLVDAVDQLFRARDQRRPADPTNIVPLKRPKDGNGSP
jgi:DNA-binding NtrC family response regulator